MVEIGKGYSRYERETIINWSEDDDHLEIYTASPRIYRRLAKIAESFGADDPKYLGNAAVFQLPLVSVSLRKKIANRDYLSPTWIKNSSH